MDILLNNLLMELLTKVLKYILKLLVCTLLNFVIMLVLKYSKITGYILKYTRNNCFPN